MTKMSYLQATRYRIWYHLHAKFSGCRDSVASIEVVLPVKAVSFDNLVIVIQFTVQYMYVNAHAEHTVRVL